MTKIIYIVYNTPLFNETRGDEGEVLSCNGDLFDSLLKARRFIRNISRAEYKSEAVLHRRVVPKNIVKKLKEGMTFHNVCLATYKSENIQNELRIKLSGTSNCWWSIYAYKL